jgi:hypothetical protein
MLSLLDKQPQRAAWLLSFSSIHESGIQQIFNSQCNTRLAAGHNEEQAMMLVAFVKS